MNPLTPARFEEFYKAATLAIAERKLAERRAREPGYEPANPPAAKEPFPWQTRLAARVCGGDWPRAVALPTAAGKTACIDIAVFALACGGPVRQPRRIFFVVDRRIVVDQAHRHATDLANGLDDADDGILCEVADALRELAAPGWLALARDDRLRIVRKQRAVRREKEEAKRRKLLSELADDEREWFDVRPLNVFALRGGMYRETAWARSPLQPTVIASTVDQVGSRLLFRGYGVSDSMKPVHAGLVGNDALILLDEAHCAKPFDQTVQAVERYRGWFDEPTAAPFRFVSISATPTEDVARAEEERQKERPTEPPLIERADDADRAHAVLGERIRAKKPAKLVVADRKPKKGETWRTVLVEKLAEEAKKRETAGGCVGIIVNRVATARDLAKALGKDAVLLTGRMRPLDRDRIFEEKLRPLLSGAGGDRPPFVVGTQCLECGADFDFDALVTECASLDALRQRFGRLNRIAARAHAPAAVVVRGDQTEPAEKESDRDPVYGNALANTWKWLRGDPVSPGAEVDFGVSAMGEQLRALSGQELADLNAPAVDAPVLFPAHLDCWVQTHPIPCPDPDPAVFLHGPKQPGQPDVQVVFRDDIRSDQPDEEVERLWKALHPGADGAERDKPTEAKRSDLWCAAIATCPPSSSEAVAVPIGVFKKWLAGEATPDDTSDVEGGVPEEADEDAEPVAGRVALRWKGAESDDTVRVGGPGAVGPGELFVVPCSAPALEQLGDFPPDGPVLDYSEEAFQRSRDVALLRLPHLNIPEDADRREEADLVSAALAPLLEVADAPAWRARAVSYFTDMKNARRREVLRHPLGGVVLVGTARLHQFDPTYLDDSEPGESFAGRRASRRAVTLEDHSRGVAAHAARFAAGCGLDVGLFTQAGLWHDVGKLDPRFQAMLRGSSPRTAVGEPLAKSGKPAGTRVEQEQLRAVHGYPKGARHELLSAALVAARAGDGGADDLLLHLTATHHGSGRPFASAVDDPADGSGPAWPLPPKLFDEVFPATSYRQDVCGWNAELPERFWRVVRRWGWWGAAYREAVFRLADHAQSATEQEHDATAPEVTTGWVALPALAVRASSHVLPLTGLDGSNPLAFLAALGTLRLADELFPGAALGWEFTNRWQPVLKLPKAMKPQDFVTRVHTRVHRTVDPQATELANQRHREYRSKKKQTDEAVGSIKERKLRGAEREAAVNSEVAPLRDQELAARREWLQALDTAVPAPFLSLGKSIAVSADEFAIFARRAAERLFQAGPGGRADSDFVAAFGCESCVDRNGNIIPTEFQLVNGSGHQFFLVTFAALIQSVTPEHIRRALFGPWTYADARQSFRWDPIDDRRYASSWEDPSGTEVRTEHGANLLAAFALPLFPTVPTATGARTTGFSGGRARPVLALPLTERLHTLDCMRSLLQLDRLHRLDNSGSKSGAGSSEIDLQLDRLHRLDNSEEALASYGVRAVFRSRKFEVGVPPLSKLNFCAAVPN